jgi:hypothetical protein
MVAAMQVADGSRWRRRRCRRHELQDAALWKPFEQRRCGGAMRGLPAGQYENERAALGVRQLELIPIHRRFLSEVVKRNSLVTQTP